MEAFAGLLLLVAVGVGVWVDAIWGIGLGFVAMVLIKAATNAKAKAAGALQRTAAPADDAQEEAPPPRRARRNVHTIRVDVDRILEDVRRGVAEDADDEFLPAAKGLGIEVSMRYRPFDAPRAEERRITIDTVTGEIGQDGTFEPHGYFLGYCHLRRAPRIFRLDRVEEMIDEETGEVLGDADDALHWMAERVTNDMKAGRGRMVRAAAD